MVRKIHPRTALARQKILSLLNKKQNNINPPIFSSFPMNPPHVLQTLKLIASFSLIYTQFSFKRYWFTKIYIFEYFSPVHGTVWESLQVEALLEVSHWVWAVIFQKLISFPVSFLPLSSSCLWNKCNFQLLH